SFGHAREDGGVQLPPAAEGQPRLGEGAAPAGEGITLNNHPRGGIQQYTFGAAEKARRSIPSATRGLCCPPGLKCANGGRGKQFSFSFEQPRLGEGAAPLARAAAPRQGSYPCYPFVRASTIARADAPGRMSCPCSSSRASARELFLSLEQPRRERRSCCFA
ncbi:hypothetical protein ACHAWF_009092, partial [Thalassiosira exigua]